LEFLVNSKAPGDRQRLLDAFETFARDHNLPPKIRAAADLALEEHLTNILNYGFSDQTNHTIRFDFNERAGEFVIEVSDDGKEFDPTKFPVPDFKIPPEQRKIGGLGIHMIRQSMDAVEYHRVNNRNVLKLTKRL